MNKAILMGRLGKDAELKRLDGGGSMMRFSIATDESWKNKQTGEWEKKTTWHNCVKWGDNSRLAPHLVKGIKVLVEGQIENREWQDEHGEKKRATQIKVFHLEFCEPKQQTQESRETDASPFPGAPGPGYSDGGSDDDIPF
jgi:single-strand DNA-binding protein